MSKRSPIKPKHVPSSGRDFTYTERERNYGNHGMSIGQGTGSAGVSLPAPIVYRAVLGTGLKPETK
jgi:hypothetical protein